MLRNKHFVTVCGAATLVGLVGSGLNAAVISRENNTDALNLGTAWQDTVDGDVVPGAADIALWDSAILGANNAALGADATWGQIQIANPGAIATISGANTLTLNGVSGVGIDMSAATSNLTISAGITLGGNQTWNVGAGRTLNTNTVDINSNGFALTKAGAGTLDLKFLNSDLTIEAGIVKLGNRPSGAVGAAKVGIVDIKTGAILQTNHINAPRVNGLTGSGVVEHSNAGAANSIYGLNLIPNLGGVTAFEGTIRNSSGGKQQNLTVNGEVAPSVGNPLGVQVFGANSSLEHTGTTTVQNASVLFNGTTTNLGASVTDKAAAFRLNNYSVVGGTGTIGLASNVEFRVEASQATQRGTLMPGDSRAGENPIGVLTIGTEGNNNLVYFRRNGTLMIDIDGALSDRLHVIGNLNLTNNNTNPAFAGQGLVENSLEVQLLGTPTLGSYTIVTYTGTLTGQFETFASVTALGYSIDYSIPGQINLIVPQAQVPEPAGLALISGMGAMLLTRRRR